MLPRRYDVRFMTPGYAKRDDFPQSGPRLWNIVKKRSRLYLFLKSRHGLMEACKKRQWRSQSTESCLILLGSCDFESSRCGYRDEETVDFKWLRHRGHTPSFGTGPSNDHTTNTITGTCVLGRWQRGEHTRRRGSLFEQLNVEEQG